MAHGDVMRFVASNRIRIPETENDERKALASPIARSRKQEINDRDCGSLAATLGNRTEDYDHRDRMMPVR